MNEPDYLNLIEDNLEDVAARRAPFVVPSVANDISIKDAVATCERITDEWHEHMKALEADCECLQQNASPCGACDTAPRRRG